MKRCPTCQKTFDDAMRFCQTDGTPLVADEAPADPYKTMVASAEDIASALRSTSEPSSAPPRPADAGPASAEEEPLQIPSEPVSSPTPASELKTRLAHSSGRDDAEVIEIPPLAEQTPSDLPSFSERSPEPPSFGGPPPPSPFASSQSEPPAPDFSATTPPIPSPFSNPGQSGSGKAPSVPDFSVQQPPAPSYSEPEPAPPSYSEPAPKPQFAEPEQSAPSPAFSPFEAQAAAPSAPLAQSEWTPPPSPVSQNQPGGKNMQSPPPAAKLNQTLPIVSLIFGILSLCCYVSPLTGIIAAVTGFLGMRNASNNPSQYGGKTLAIVGLILGILFFLIGIGYWIFLIFFGGLSMMMQMANGR